MSPNFCSVFTLLVIFPVISAAFSSVVLNLLNSNNDRTNNQITWSFINNRTRHFSRKFSLCTHTHTYTYTFEIFLFHGNGWLRVSFYKNSTWLCLFQKKIWHFLRSCVVTSSRFDENTDSKACQASIVHIHKRHRLSFYTRSFFFHRSSFIRTSLDLTFLSFVETRNI